MRRIFDWFHPPTSKVEKRLRAIEKQIEILTIKLMNAQEAIEVLTSAQADHAEAEAEIRAELLRLNARITELEALIASGALPDAVAAKINEVKASSRVIADIISNTPPAGQTTT
jgi:septal ring factor EnvC (AmiA/AmiB activator)